MSNVRIIAVAGFLIAIAMIAGALGSHVLRPQLDTHALEIYETAVRYQFYHSIGLLGIGLTLRTLEHRLIRWSGTSVLAGVILFSGTLFAMSFGAPPWIGAITPVGGLALILGWVMFAAGVLRSRDV